MRNAGINRSGRSEITRRFHELYEKGALDHTLRTDAPEREMFSKSPHLMLAVVTCYAVGLVYDAGVAPEEELRFLKGLLLKEYATDQDSSPRPAATQAMRRAQHV